MKKEQMVFKRAVLILLFSSFSCLSQARDYLPILNGKRIWELAMEKEPWGIPGIFDEKYNPVYGEEFDPNYLLSYHEENGALYDYAGRVLIDLRLNEGDSFVNVFGENLKVVFTGDTLLCSQVRKRLVLQNTQTGRQEEWVEGIGSLRYGVFADIECPDEVIGLSVYGDDGQVAIFEQETSTYWSKRYVPKEPLKEDEEGTIEFCGEELQIRRTRLCSCQPMNVKCCITGNTIYLVYHDWYYRMLDSYADNVDKYGLIDMKIGRFPPGVYDVFEQGRYYGKVECKGKVSGISAPEEREQDLKGTGPELLLYDLTGRRLSDRPAKGIYIENGRKMCR